MQSLQLALRRSWDRLDDCSRQLGYRLSQRSWLVAQSISPRERCLSFVGVPQPGILVRHLGRRLGSSPERLGSFRPLVSSGDGAIHQRQGIASSGVWSPLLHSTVGQFHGCGFRRQLYSNRLSPQPGRYKVSSTEFCCSEDPTLGRFQWFLLRSLSRARTTSLRMPCPGPIKFRRQNGH